MKCLTCKKNTRKLGTDECIGCYTKYQNERALKCKKPSNCIDCKDAVIYSPYIRCYECNIKKWTKNEYVFRFDE